MNSTKLNSQFVFDTIGISTVEWLRSIDSVRGSILTYLQPGVASITGFLNLLVFVLCIVIYLKTKKKSHKPAFIYIGFLAFFDMLLGMAGVLYSLSFGNKGLTQENGNMEIRDCTTSALVANFMQFASLYILGALTVDRYIFIKRPLHYPMIMTPCRTWLLILASLLAALIQAILSASTIELPPEYESGQFCTWVHCFPGWLQILMALTFIILLIMVIVVYSVMLNKFRQSRKKLEALKKANEEEDFTKSNLKFQRGRGIFKQKCKADLPGMPDEKLQMIKIKKDIEDGKEKTFTQECEQRKRRPSSVVRAMNVLVSHVRAATYILALVVTLLVTWTPFFLWSVYESIRDYAVLTPIHPNSTLNGTMIFSCVQTSLRNKKCNMEIGIENEFRFEYEDRIKYYSHIEESIIIEYILGVFMTLFNSMLNPVLYAFWYNDFRTYIMQIPEWFKPKKQKSDEFNFEIQIVKF